MPKGQARRVRRAMAFGGWVGLFSLDVSPVPESWGLGAGSAGGQVEKVECRAV